MIMKKFTLIAAVLISSFAATAQSFTTDKDTSKTAWLPGGYPVEVNVNAMNTGSSPVSITWKVVDFQKGPKWTFEGLCDNNLCQYDPNGTSGLTNGTLSYTTVPFPNASSTKANFKCDWGADTADFGTKSSITIEMTSGSTVKYATFIGYKGTLGSVNTTVKIDNDVAIFPNPSSSYIDVRYSASSDVKSITIYNLIGKVVNVYKVTDKNSARCEFNADMPSGIYFVRIADSKGNVIATRKITHQ